MQFHVCCYRKYQTCLWLWGKKRRNKAELMNWYSHHIYYIGNNSSKNRLYGNDMHEGPTPA